MSLNVMREQDLISLDLMNKLMSFDTTSDQSNLPMIDFIREYLENLGVESYLTYDQFEKKANLFATIGPSGQPGVVISGHTDVVPVTNQRWTVEPYAVTKRGERFYGRGTSDMKTFIAIALAFAEVFRGKDLKIPIHYAFSYDEEVGALGVPLLIEDMIERVVLPAACIVGEPSSMRVVTAHKGKIVCRAEFKGVEAHTGVAHIGANAIEAAGKTIAYLSEMGRQFREGGPFDNSFEAPAYTTIQVCIVEGGTAVNIVPNFASFDFDIRYLPTQDPYEILDDVEEFVAKSVLPELTSVSTSTSVDIAMHPGETIPLNTSEDEMVVELARWLTGQDKIQKVGFGTEAGYFQKAGIPTVVCGPGHIDQAHQPDEFIEMQQIALCEEFFHRLTSRLCTGRL